MQNHLRILVSVTLGMFKVLNTIVWRTLRCVLIPMEMGRLGIQFWMLVCAGWLSSTILRKGVCVQPIRTLDQWDHVFANLGFTTRVMCVSNAGIILTRVLIIEHVSAEMVLWNKVITVWRVKHVATTRSILLTWKSVYATFLAWSLTITTNVFVLIISNSIVFFKNATVILNHILCLTNVFHVGFIRLVLLMASLVIVTVVMLLKIKLASSNARRQQSRVPTAGLVSVHPD